MGLGHGTAYTEHSATDIILEFYSSSLAELQFMDLGDASGQRCHCRVVVFLTPALGIMHKLVWCLMADRKSVV